MPVAIKANMVARSNCILLFETDTAVGSYVKRKMREVVADDCFYGRSKLRLYVCDTRLPWKCQGDSRMGLSAIADW